MPLLSNNVDLLKRDFIEFSGKRQDQLMFLENKAEEFKIPIWNIIGMFL